MVAEAGVLCGQYLSDAVSIGQDFFDAVTPKGFVASESLSIDISTSQSVCIC